MRLPPNPFDVWVMQAPSLAERVRRLAILSIFGIVLALAAGLVLGYAIWGQ